MKKECTEQDLRELARSAQAVFEAVTLTEAPLCDGWQDDGLRVDYELRNGRVDCVRTAEWKRTANAGSWKCAHRWQAMCCRKSA